MCTSLSAKVPEGLADHHLSPSCALRQAIAAAMDFRKVGVLKLPRPEAEKGGSMGYMPCWECLAHMLKISRAVSRQ